MKCFTAGPEYHLPGLEVANDHSVKLHGELALSLAHGRARPSSLEENDKRAFLNEELKARLIGQQNSDSFQMTGAVLLRCDVQKRSEVWLMPETDATRNQALIRWGFVKYGDLVKLEASTTGDGSDILYKAVVQQGSRTEMRLLVVLPAGSSLSVETDMKQSNAKYIWLPPKSSIVRTVNTMFFNGDDLLRVTVTGATAVKKE